MTIAFGNSLVLFKTSGFPRLVLSVFLGFPRLVCSSVMKTWVRRRGAGSGQVGKGLTDILVNQ